MLLSHEELLELVRNGVVEDCPEELVNGASIDVTLGDILMKESYAENAVINYSGRGALTMRPLKIMEHGYPLVPGEFILASSQQTFNLPADLACEYKLKSSMARIGLNHLNAGWCDPTWHGSVLTLELVNTTRFHSIRLNVGDRIGQVVFFRCKPVPEAASYARKGRYNNDPRVQGAR